MIAALATTFCDGDETAASERLANKFDGYSSYPVLSN
jgi:hypothetical protein